VSPTTAAQLAEALGLPLVGPDRAITAVAPLDAAGPEALAYAEGAVSGEAGCLITKAPIEGRSVIVAADPKLAFIRALALLFPEARVAGVHPSAVVEGQLGQDVTVGANAVIGAGAVIGDRVWIGEGVIVGPGCVVGDDTRLFPKVVLYPGVLIGRRCRVHAGAVLGADGFSYHPTAHGPVKVPQVGGLVIEDEVEIGANTCIDRAFLTETRIGRGAKLDNLVQIGHNVRLGPACVIAAQVGVAGSTTFGAGVLVGGQAGFTEHLNVGDGARVAAGSGVIRDVPARETWLGVPAMPSRQARRILAALKDLPDLAIERARRLRAAALTND
jgi:UDP-3-O-[3-hydroxymyristoyl] glucosamine N-acyltransferase